MFDRKPTALLIGVFYLVLFLNNDKSYAQNTWQQRCDYQINVRLDDVNHRLHGNIEMEYHNQSPIALTEIWMHLWPNAYKNNKTAFAIQQLENSDTKFHYAEEDKRGYIDSLEFKVNGQTLVFVENEKFPDIIKLMLPRTLAPGESITINTPFVVKIPNSFSRLGHVDQSYQITQWYPKPAVFDDRGWHPMPYLDQGEFYSEFGKFDVKITLPKNYIVGATGELQNADELAILDSISVQTKLIKEYPEKDNTPPSSNEYKTLHYIQDNIHDFAWFADKRFHVMNSEIELPHSKRKVKTYTMYTNENAHLWKDAVKYIDSAVYYYSLWNGEYPYNYCTAVDGSLSAGDGMEYPMITVIGDVDNAKTLDLVITHEVGHNWFYGILGSNEREYGWMDEGINSYYENRYMRMRYSDGKMIDKSKRGFLTHLFGLDFFPADYDHYLTYQLTASTGNEQAIETHSEEFNRINYGTIMYTKTSLMLRYLEQYLGTEKFDSVMQVYYSTWKFKHPYPEDLKEVFERETGENFDWFFKDIIQSIPSPDFKLKEIKKEGEQLRIKIGNTTDVAGPVFVSSFDKKGNTLETYKTQAFYGNAFVYVDRKEVKKVVIDPLYIIPEQNRNDNTIKAHGLFKKVEPLRLQFLTGINRPDKTNLYYLPIIGYNVNDGLMPGLALYNNFFPLKNVEWAVAPMYGLKSEKLNGTGQISVYSHPKSVKEVHTHFSLNSFSSLNGSNDLFAMNYYERFLKLAIGTEITLLPSSARSSIKNSLSYRFILNRNKNINSDFFQVFYRESITANSFHQFQYTRRNSKTINPNKLTILYEYANDSYTPITQKTHHKFFAVYKQKVNYTSSRKGLQIRAFAGTIFASADRTNEAYFFSVSGNIDYTYDKAFFNRYDTYRQQFHESDGAFKANTFDLTKRTLLGVNIKAPLKSKFPIGVFADVAGANDFQQLSGMELSYDAGIYFPFITDVVELYFPVVVDYKYFEPQNYKDRIRVIIDFQAIQPLNLRRKLQLF